MDLAFKKEDFLEVDRGPFDGGDTYGSTVDVQIPSRGCLEKVLKPLPGVFDMFHSPHSLLIVTPSALGGCV